MTLKMTAPNSDLDYMTSIDKPEDITPDRARFHALEMIYGGRKDDAQLVEWMADKIEEAEHRVTMQGEQVKIAQRCIDASRRSMAEDAEHIAELEAKINHKCRNKRLSDYEEEQWADPDKRPHLIKAIYKSNQQLRKHIAELEARLISNGICPKCDAEIVVDYRAGKATNHRCKCGWKLEQEDE